MTVPKLKEKVLVEDGVSKMYFECWVKFLTEFTPFHYKRYISNLEKKIKQRIYNLRTENGENFNYFVDLNVRETPSTTAFLSLTTTLIYDKKNRERKKLKIYLDQIKKIITENPEIEIYYNEKKRRS